MSDTTSPCDRRRFLKSVAAASVLAGAGTMLAACGKGASAGSTSAGTAKSSGVSSAKPIHWKMVTTWPKNFPALGTGANHLAELITTMSGGRLVVKVYGAGELVPAMGVFDAVQRGTAEMGHAAAYYWKGKHEAAQFFGAVPFGLTAMESSAWLQHGGGQALWDELYADFQLKPFCVGHTGVQMGGWFNREIHSADDFQGLKMRMPGLGAEVLRQLGATVVTLPGGEIFQALKSGAIDATEWVGPYNDLAFGLHQAAKMYYWPGWHEPNAIIEATVHRPAFEALPSDLQAVVTQACAAAASHMVADFTARNSTALQTLVSEHGVQLKRFPEDLLRKLGKTSQSVVADVAQGDAMTAKIYESYRTFQKTALSWDAVSESGYSAARALTADIL